MKASNRKKQIERQFLRRILKALRAEGHSPTPMLKLLLKSELCNAAMVGACEERNRILDYLRAGSAPRYISPNEVDRFIVSRGVLEVLGYNNEQGGKEI